jgi:hypothetical protein
MNIDKKYKSQYYHFRNQTLNWLTSDTEENYNKNYETRYHELKKYGWVDNHFTYKFNSHGFRCEEFNGDPSIMTLGCSNTIGIGLPVDKTWPELLAKELNMKCANLGIGGGSLDTVFRLCHGYIDVIKPKIVVLLSPPGPRIELFVNDDVYNLGSWTFNDKYMFDKSSFFHMWTTGKNNIYFNTEKNILAIKQLCEQRNIKFINKDNSELYIEKNTLARDLLHTGIENHKLLIKNLLLHL